MRLDHFTQADELATEMLKNSIIAFVTYLHLQISLWFQTVLNRVAGVWCIAFWMVRVHLDVH